MIPTAHDRQAAISYAADAVHAWVRHATPGTRLSYHEGFLAIDRWSDISVSSGAATLLYYSDRGIVNLTQQKLAPMQYIYYAQRSHRLIPMTRAREGIAA